MPDLFDEIKEDVKQEKYAKLWAETGNYVIGGVVAVVLVTAGFVVFKNYNLKQYEKQGNELYNAFSSELSDDSGKAVTEYSTLASEGKASYSAIANMRKAAILSKEGKESEATGIYKDISEEKDNPREIKELAEILYLQSAIAHENDPSTLNRLEEIANGKGVFRYSAKEILGFSKFNLKEYEEAKKIFEELTNDSKTPARMKNRSNEMLSAINAKNVGNNG